MNNFTKHREKNFISSIIKLVEILNIKVTKTAIKAIANHPDYPSIGCIVDALKEWNVDSVAIQTNIEEIFKCPMPSIGHFSDTATGRFVIVKEAKENLITFFDTDKGWLTETSSDFENKWSGNLIILATKEQSGEKDFKKNRKAEQLNTLRFPAILSLSFCVLLLTVFTGISFNPGNSFIWLQILIYKIIGAVICVLLIIKDLNDSNKFVSQLCTLGGFSKSVDCNKIIHSSASKLLDLISVSEIGVFYFVGGLAAMCICLVTGNINSLLSVLALMNLLSLPYTVFSFYYQGVIIKQWCPLCMAVQLILWLEFFVLHSYLSLAALPLSFWNILFLSFAAPMIIWMAIKPSLLLAQRVRPLQKELSVFKRSPRVLEALLSQGQSIEFTPLPNDIIIGDSSDNESITVLLSPYCGPCARAFNEIRDLLLAQPNIQVRFRFISSNPLGTQLLEHLLSYVNTHGPEAIIELLEDWYNQVEKDIEKWKVKFPLIHEIDSDKAEITLDQWREWVLQANIKSTPTIVINGKVLPTGLKPLDILPLLEEHYYSE